MGNLLGGMIPRWLVNRGWSVNRGRKTTMFVASAGMPFLCFAITPGARSGAGGGVNDGNALLPYVVAECRLAR